MIGARRSDRLTALRLLLLVAAAELADLATYLVAERAPLGWRDLNPVATLGDARVTAAKLLALPAILLVVRLLPRPRRRAALLGVAAFATLCAALNLLAVGGW